MRRHYWAGIALLMATVFISSGQTGENNSTKIMCSDLEDCYNQGMELLSQGNCSEAYDVMQSAITFNQTNSDAWVGKGRAAACTGNFSEAIKCCEAAIVWDKENPQAYAVMAEVLLAQNRTDEARAMIKDAVERNISNPMLWIECGKVFSRLEMWADAQKCFNNATDIDINNAEGWYLEANALQKLGRFEDAILVYNQSVNINSSSVDAWLGRSETLVALKLYTEAEKSYSKVLDLNPTNEDALFQKGLMLLMLKRNEEAVELLANLTERAPNNAAAWMREGLALAKLGKCSESLAAYDKSIALEGNNTEAWIGRGDAQLCLGLVNQAQETYEAILKKDRFNGPVQERIAQVHYMNGKYQAALTYVRESIDQDKIPPADYPRAWLIYANALNATHQHDNAIKMYSIAEEKISHSTPLDPEIDLKDVEWARERTYLHRADDEYKNNLALNRSDFAHARDYFENLTETNRSDMDALMMLGICNLKLWQFENATKCFDEVLNVDPTNLTAAELMSEVKKEQRPHIILVDFSNEGINFTSIIDNPWNILNWRPPESFRAELKNMADVGGIAELSIWTVPGSHVAELDIDTFGVPINGNERTTFKETVNIPRGAFTDLPMDPYGILGVLNELIKVPLRCEIKSQEALE